MKQQAMLTQERLKGLLRYVKSTGIFYWKVQAAWRIPPGTVAGGIRRLKGNQVYMYTRIDGVNHQLHRLAFLYVNGVHPTFDVDHKDGNGLNNKWTNLREATPTMNSENRRKAHRGRTDDTLPLGVDWREKDQKFVARIRVQKKLLHLGFFKTADDASKAYLKAKRKFHKGCTL